jgi:hypothetical protein
MTRSDAVVCTTHGELRRERYRVAALGAAIACALALLAALVIGWGLDSWRTANHERLLAEAVAAVDARLSECKKDVARYSDIAQLERDAVAAMGGRR